MKNYTVPYKKWLEREGKKEGMEVKVRFIKNDYTAWYWGNSLRIFKISRRIGTIEIPKNFFTSEDPKFTEKELKAVGLHELGHLKTLKVFGVRGINRQQKKRPTWSEERADEYAKDRGFGKYLATSLEKSNVLKERLSMKIWWHIKIWRRKRAHGHKYPKFEKRLRMLRDC